MFEFIGIVVVVYVLFKLFKAFVVGAMKGTLARARDKAVEGGVPYSFAADVAHDSNLLKKARDVLVSDNKEVATFDVYEQYACAIAYLYALDNKINDEDLDKAKTLIYKLVRPQVELLESEGKTVFINQITYVYFSALVSAFVGKTADIEQVKQVIKYVFSGQDNSASIESGCRMVLGSSDYSQQLDAMKPIAANEVVSGYGEFFVRYTRQANRDFDRLMSSDDFDPTQVDPLSFLKI